MRWAEVDWSDGVRFVVGLPQVRGWWSVRGSYRPDYDAPAVGPKGRVKLPSFDPNCDDTQEVEVQYETGAYIKRWMGKLRLSYEDVAATLGVHPITVRNWEKAKRLRPIVKLAFDKAFVDKW